MGLARELAERIAAMQYGDLPEAAIYWSKVAILDTVGVALAGAHEKAPRLVDEVLGLPSGTGRSLIIGTARRAAALDAALINGTAAHALDFDNTASNMGGHVSATAVPALLAAGETSPGTTGRDLLLAHTVGFETARIGLALNPCHTEKGWHPTSTVGVFAVTAACARLLGLTVEQTETALALSTSFASGTKANFGTMAKPLHAGQCARNGLLCAMLARKGFTANREAFEHRQGYLHLFGEPGRVDAARILEGWARPLDIVDPGASYKLYPCCYSVHSAIEAALDIVRRHGLLEPGKVARIDARIPERALAHTDRPRPQSPLEAKFSLQYCVARALLHGKVVLEYFDDDAHLDPAVQTLLPRVHAAPYTGKLFSEDDPLDAEVRVTLHGGKVYEAKVPRPLGRTSKNPIAREDIDAKFLDCAGRLLSPSSAEAVRRKLWTLESLDCLHALTSLLEFPK